MRRWVVVLVCSVVATAVPASPSSAAESSFEMSYPGTTTLVVANGAVDMTADGRSILSTGTFGTSVRDEDGEWFPPDPTDDEIGSPRGSTGRVTKGGDEILLVTSEPMLGADAGSQLYAIDRTTSAVVRLSTDGSTQPIFAVDASADGSLVVYARSRTGGSSADLWVVDRTTDVTSKLTGSGSVTETAVGSAGTNGGVAVAADGSLVAWIATDTRTALGSDEGRVVTWRRSNGAATTTSAPFVARGLDVADDGSAVIVVGSATFDTGHGLYRVVPGAGPALVAADTGGSGACHDGAIRRPNVAGDGVVWARAVAAGTCELASTTVSTGATVIVDPAGDLTSMNASGHLRSADGSTVVSSRFDVDLALTRTVVLRSAFASGSDAVDIDYAPDGAAVTVTFADGLDRTRFLDGSDSPPVQLGPSLRPGERVVAREVVPDRTGFWLFTDLGRALPMGGAPFFGDLRDLTLNGGVIDAIATPSGEGYYMVGTDGGVFSFGDAEFFGSMGGIPLNGPVNGLAPTPTGRGYWLVADDGGIFSFGDAEFFGSMGGRPLNAPMGGILPSADGAGYLMFADDGGMFAFGDVAFFGSLGGRALPAPIVRADLRPDGDAYALVDVEGRVTVFTAG